MGAGSKLPVLVLLGALSACGSSTSAGDERGAGGTNAAGQSAGGGAAHGGSAADGSATGGSGGASGALAQGGSGGAGSGASGTSATAGMPGSSGASSVSQGEACVTYAVAFCKRSLECTGDDVSDAVVYGCASGCPDTVFSPGSTRTVESVLACAEEVEKLSCEDHDAAHYPPCVSAGTKALGEPCVYNSQCASLLCKVADACGVCVRPVGMGEDCSGSDVGCGGGLSCRNGVCKGDPEVHEPGEPCADFTECDQVDAHCSEDHDGICVLYPGENESCADTNICRSGLYCQGPDKICTVLPGAGEPCGDDVRSSQPACESGLGCTERQRPDGTSGGTCVAMYEAEPGESCLSWAARCAGSSCRCDDATCSDAHCIAPLRLGDACAPETTTETCLPPLECVSGVCTAPSYGGDYEAKCMP